MSSKTIILGAGLAGLGAAKHIAGSVVYEAKSHPGGHVYSHEQGGIHFDEGAHICHAKEKEWLEQLFANAGNVVHMDQSFVSNWWHGHWVTYPVQNHLCDLPVEARIQALSEIVSAQMNSRGNPPRNYNEWCRAQYGNYLTDNFYKEYTEKYWRTRMEEMDVDWLSGRLLPSQIERIIHGAIAPLDEKQSVFSTFHYPSGGGFFSFFMKMYEGVDIRLDAKAVEVNPVARTVSFADGNTVSYEQLVSTIPLNTLVNCIKGIDIPDAVLNATKKLRHTQLIGINIILNKPQTVPYHWFYIYDSEIDVSRVKIMSNLIPKSTLPGKTVLQAEIFRRDDETFDIESLKAKAVRDLAKVLDYDPVSDVDGVYHVHASHAYPIPTLGRTDAVALIMVWLNGLGIHSIGLCGQWKYVWSNEAYEAGRATAEVLCS